MSKLLFSQHFLHRRLRELPEWQEAVSESFDRVLELYTSKKPYLSGLNESQTEEELIKPILNILGFAYITQVTAKGKGRAERPDYALFDSQERKNEALPLQGDEAAFYHKVSAIAEAKYWERSLSKVSKNDKRDILKNENPSFQIVNYLTGTGVDWGILTNGREWRLYYRHASSRAKESYQIDLVDILESDKTEEQKRDAFKYFWLFFRRDAFVKDAYGNTFLDRVREGSNTYATQVESELKKRVFDRVFPDLAGGFVTSVVRGGNTPDPQFIYEATLSFLYKILFLLYAEGKNLLPSQFEAYREYGLIGMTQAIAERLDRGSTFSQTATGWYNKLLDLFQIVDRGDAALQVPRYNGGLFHFQLTDDRHRDDYPENYFLQQYKLPDAILAPALDKLARIAGDPVDYSFLGVRQLGSIYEGLLEYRIAIDDAETGSVHLENDKGERKATGSYYTPDYIVKYIVRQTLTPILEARVAQFETQMSEIETLRTRLEDKRLGKASVREFNKQIESLEKQAIATLLDIRVCDPAMGSGHFLVEAVDFLTDEIASLLTRFDNNPILEMLDGIRGEIVANLAEQGIAIAPERLKDEDLLHRVVMKRCIYGVDLNRMAVELAKVSLWLHSFTVGAPLSFLDHHLRWGNSLVGATAREAEAAMSQEESGQLLFLTGPFVGLLQAANIMRGISTLSDATFAEVERSEQLFRDFDAAAKRYKQLLDVFVAQYFGVKDAKNLLERLGTSAIEVDRATLSKKDAAVFAEAERLWQEKRFFHWDLEFPEVFIDLENASWKENPGFDAVVGNPPYSRSITLKNLDSQTWAYYPQHYKAAEKREFDLYLCFTEKGANLLNLKGHLGFIMPNKWFTTRVGEALREILSQFRSVERIVDFGAFQVFEDVTTYTCLLFLNGSASETINVAILEDADKYANPLPGGEGSWQIGNLYNKYLGAKAWSFNLGGSGSLLRKLESFPKLKEICTVFSGTGTRSDHIFIMQRRGNQYYSRSIRQWVQIENELMRPALTGRNIQPYESFGDNYLLFPYFVVDTTQFQVLHRETLENQYPQAWSYLALNPNNRQILQNRDRILFRDREAWYAYGRPQNMYLLGVPKIVFPDVADRGRFTFDAEGKFIVDTAYGIIFREQVQFSLLALISVLNSSIMTFFLKQTGTPLRGGYFRMKTAYLNPFPIPPIQFETEREVRQRHTDRLISQYAQFQTSENPDDILASVDRHLQKDPEEADVIHDFLAYLAEQMIQLNKAKQAEIDSFLKWLSREIGCAIDDLTNKTQIKNYLGDYYKNEPHLKFEDLLKILKKNKKKLGIDPQKRQLQDAIGAEYQHSLDTLLPLKAKLKRCDALIDRIVYKLYGLTEDEIAIVESRTSL